MKKVLMILGVVFGVVVVGFVGVLIWANASGAKLQEKFFSAILSGDPKQVTALFHPAMKDEVDEPVLAVWMAAVKENLGAYKGLSKTDFNTSLKWVNGVSLTESAGTVNFEKGQASCELVFRDGKLVKFNVKSEKIPPAWFKAPASTQLYQDRGKEFWTRFLDNRPADAFQMMHPNLQGKMPLDKLTALVKENCGKAGKLQSITFKSEQYSPSDQILKVTYTLECEKAKTTPTVKFEFEGLKGHLVAFNLAGEE